jgi:hypothetical protein
MLMPSQAPPVRRPRAGRPYDGCVSLLVRHDEAALRLLQAEEGAEEDEGQEGQEEEAAG